LAPACGIFIFNRLAGGVYHRNYLKERIVFKEDKGDRDDRLPEVGHYDSGRVFFRLARAEELISSPNLNPFNPVNGCFGENVL